MMHKSSLAALPLLITSVLAQGTGEVEPNNTPALANVLAAGNQGDGAIGVVSDVDFWKVTVTGNSDLRCWLNPGIGSSLADSDLALIAPDGTTQLAFNDNAVSPASWMSAIVIGNLTAGDYYLRVRSSQSFDPSGMGSYTLDVIAAPPGTYVVTGGGGPGIPTPVVEGPETNDPRQAGFATPSFENSINTGNIASATAGTSFTDPGADYDFFELTITRQGMLTMETLATAPAPAATNTVIFLVDAGLTVIGFDDDGGSGQLSLLSRYVIPGTYYVIVKGQNVGNYALDILLSPMPPPGAASVVVQPGGCGGATLNVRSTVAGPSVITEVPVLGSTFCIDGANLPPNGIVLHVIGWKTLAAPYNMSAIGAPGCWLHVDPIDQSAALANAAGNDYWSLNLPLQISLIGLALKQQIAAIDPAANALGLTMTNLVSSVCGAHN